MESLVEKTVCNRAEKQGWYVRKVQWVGRRGAPDRLFIKDGRHVWIEFKDYGKDARANQESEHEKLRKAGAEVYVCVTEVQAARALRDYVI